MSPNEIKFLSNIYLMEHLQTNIPSVISWNFKIALSDIQKYLLLQYNKTRIKVFHENVSLGLNRSKCLKARKTQNISYI